MVKTKFAFLLAAMMCLVAFIAFADTPQEALSGGPHGDADAEAFIHWDEDDPAVVPAGCAKCHAGAGFIDFVGADGTEAGVVDNDAAPGVLTCDTCHNDGVAALTSVVFPSGAEVDIDSAEAPCVQCHQGRSYGGAVDAAAEGVDADTVMEGQRFINVHYAAAGATRAGSVSGVGYEYAGAEYVGEFGHAGGYDVCAACHDQHSLELKLDGCMCHGAVTDPGAIRMSTVDYDGDGDVAEGMKGEIETLHAALLPALEAAGAVYDAHSYPYWFDAAGESFAAWTPRLLKAAYNYQLVAKEGGLYAHNPKYGIQLLIDSIADLGADVSAYTRP
ncbi:polyheme membrane-associated cytochrome C [Candidatus Bipolaricaulota bacterium]